MNPSSSLALPALVMGLLGGSHCVVMCGGVVAVTCSALPFDARRSLGAQLPFVVAFNAGRIASYAAAGAVVGSLGTALASFGAVDDARLALRLVAAVMMVVVGLYVAGLARTLRWLERMGEPLWRRLAPWAQRLVPLRSPVQALALGALWGWMPCGLVYAALAAALTTGTTTGGAITMIAFGVGTLPTLVAIGSAAALARRVARKKSARVLFGAILLLFGLVQIVHVGAAWSAPPRAPLTCCHPG